MNTIRGIGLDLGETLIFYRDIPLSWAALYPEALGSVALKCGLSPGAHGIAQAGEILSAYNTRIFPRTAEVSASEILSRVLRCWQVDPAVHLSAAMEAFFTFFQQRMCAYPETMEVLRSLRERGLRLGILTDVPYGMPRNFVERDIDGAGITGLFDVLLTSVEVGVRKPDPAGFLALATRLGIAPHEMLYVGNESKDVIGASRAGAIAILIDRTNDGGNYGQQFTIKRLSEIQNML